MANDEVEQLARDLDKLTGEDIIKRLLTGHVLLLRQNAEQKAMISALTDQVGVLTKLVDSHQHAIELLTGHGKVH